jgi:hypothetical protein
MNMVMDYGSALGNEELSGSIDFNFAFAQPPIVLLTAANTINIGVSVKPGSIKTTGFSYVVSSMDGVSATIMYLAVGPIL